jgi:hypothetical protein
VSLLQLRPDRDRLEQQGQRRRAWFDIRDAIGRVRETELRTLIGGLEHALAA